jgi:hypothetical protein
MTYAADLFLAVACTLGGISAQSDGHRLTLPDVARLHAPEPVVQVRTREIVFETLESVLPKADLVIHGRVGRAKSYLSDDQRDIYTDYVITPIRVMRQRIATPAPKPGVQPPAEFVIRRWGGHLTIGGVPVTQEDSDVRQFKVGEELLLLLRFDVPSGKYILPSSVSGTFSVVGQRIEPIVKGGERHPIFDTVRRMSLSDFEGEVLRLTK